MQHLLTDVPPHTHTRIHSCVCVRVRATVLIPCLQLISHDFIHVYSKKKLFNAFKCKQNAHSHSLTLTLALTLPLILTQSVTFTYLCAVTHPYIYSRTQLIHSVALGCLFISFPHSSFHLSISPRLLLLLLLAASYLLKWSYIYFPNACRFICSRYGYATVKKFAFPSAEAAMT